MGLRRAAHVAWRRVGDETVLIHLRNKRIYVLNSSGGFFWHGLDGARGTEQFLERLGLEEPLPDDAPVRVESFLQDLQKSDLVDANGPADEANASLPEFPLHAFVPPELVWQEELRNFGISCAFISGSSAACDAVPTT
jgi:Coenzyme PQQ synthesis protein D (PqqD)